MNPKEKSSTPIRMVSPSKLRKFYVPESSVLQKKKEAIFTPELKSLIEQVSSKSKESIPTSSESSLRNSVLEKAEPLKMHAETMEPSPIESEESDRSLQTPEPVIQVSKTSEPTISSKNSLEEKTSDKTPSEKTPAQTKKTVPAIPIEILREQVNPNPFHSAPTSSAKPRKDASLFNKLYVSSFSGESILEKETLKILQPHSSVVGFAYLLLDPMTNCYIVRISNGLDLESKSNFILARTETEKEDWENGWLFNLLGASTFVKKKLSSFFLSGLQSYYFYSMEHLGVQGGIALFFKRDTVEAEWRNVFKDEFFEFLTIAAPLLRKFLDQAFLYNQPNNLLEDRLDAFRRVSVSGQYPTHFLSVHFPSEDDRSYFQKKDFLATIPTRLGPKDLVLDIEPFTVLVYSRKNLESMITKMTKEYPFEVRIRSKYYPDHGSNPYIYT